MSVDIKPLFNSKLLGEYNELTKLASMIRRKALTDRVRDLMMNLTDYRQAALARESVVKLMRIKGKDTGQLEGKSPLDRQQTVKRFVAPLLRPVVPMSRNEALADVPRTKLVRVCSTSMVESGSIPVATF
jgi:hypothetical protein